jgi:hypothetical protein
VTAAAPVTATGIDLFWLPLGAGGHSVRWNGRVYEAACAVLAHRAACPLYHSALRVVLPTGSWTVEMTPVWAAGGRRRGVVAEGPVGARAAGRSRLFRYEVHCWPDGVIADLDEAVGGPVRVSSAPEACRRLLAVLPGVPRPVWGRDELQAGEMWNSNSVTAWALSRSGVDAASVCPPAGGRAPGWAAGVVVAGRHDEARPTRSR